MSVQSARARRHGTGAEAWVGPSFGLPARPSTCVFLHKRTRIRLSTPHTFHEAGISGPNGLSEHNLDCPGQVWSVRVVVSNFVPFSVEYPNASRPKIVHVHHAWCHVVQEPNFIYFGRTCRESCFQRFDHLHCIHQGHVNGLEQEQCFLTLSSVFAEALGGILDASKLTLDFYDRNRIATWVR